MPYKCKFEGCNKHPSCNFKGERIPLYCSQHKLQDMVDIINKRCKFEGCDTRPNCNFKRETKGLYCSQHKLQDMVDIRNKRCKSYLCSTQISEKYEGYCLFCYMNIFPERPVSRNYKTKEFSVVDFIKTTYPNMDWVADKTIQNGCSKKRPDLVLDLGYQVLIVEIDENQHVSYDCSCDNKRIMELSQDLGHRSIIFIRFNPDDYYKNGIKITSCWSKNKQGICIVKKSKKKEWEIRLNTLKEQINYWIHTDNITDKTIETIQLFYDE